MSQKYRVLTLWQPYATFIAMGLKKFETRSWNPITQLPPKPRLQPGEIIMIHAAKRKLETYEKSLLGSKALANALMATGRVMPVLPYGAIVCACRFIDAHPTDEFQAQGIERKLGNYQPGRYAWELELLRVPPEPIPATGKQGIWVWQMPEREVSDE
ncbi:MAG: hypothetical protein AAF787_00055 [Chloroflexota bacterium]